MLGEDNKRMIYKPLTKEMFDEIVKDLKIPEPRTFIIYSKGKFFKTIDPEEFKDLEDDISYQIDITNRFKFKND